MSDHHPFCFAKDCICDPTRHSAGFCTHCICDRLLACEQRVRSAELAEAKALLASRDEAWYAGVDAAWIAVGNVPCATTTHGDDFRDIPGPIVKRNALAAIDALREGEK